MYYFNSIYRDGSKSLDPASTLYPSLILNMLDFLLKPATKLILNTPSCPSDP